MENVNDNYLISVLVYETVCQRLEGQKASAIKCDSCTEKGDDFWLFCIAFVYHSPLYHSSQSPTQCQHVNIALQDMVTVLLTDLFIPFV